jgi:hypothetical protein
MNGSVVAIEGWPELTGFVLAHECGHYLGLSHRDNEGNNLLFPTVPNGGFLDNSQGGTIRSHCFCRG